MDSGFGQLRTDAYAQSKGFALKVYLLDCIRRGQWSNIKAVITAPSFLREMEQIFGDDLTLAHMSYTFVWSQAHRAAVEGGLSEEAASHIYNKCFMKAQRIATIREFIELNAHAFEEFAEGVAAAAKEDTSLAPLVRQCRLYIREHIYEPLTVRQISEAMHFSKSHLAHVFKSETGGTLIEVIQQEKISEARRLIEFAPLSLTEIGQRLGFCSQSHFTRVFHQITGTTPSQYRRTRIVGKASQEYQTGEKDGTITQSLD
jgi:AraC-like DNA-binding protein